MAEAISSNGKPNAMAPNGKNVHMLDYGMLWVHSLQEYSILTGDYDFVYSLYPALDRFMGYLTSFKNPSTGLLDVPIGHWAETAYVDILGDDSRYGQSTVLNALYYETLRRAASIAEELGESVAGLEWTQDAQFIREQVNTHLYLADENLYLSGIVNGEPILPTPHAQAWALAYGIVAENNIDLIVNQLLTLLSDDPTKPNVEIFGMYWVLEALGKTGYIQEAMQIIKTYFGWMLDQGAKTWWEGFYAYRSYKGSLSHGWGSAPTWFLSTYGLGARQTGVGSWTLRPAIGDFTKISGSIPMGDDNLHIYWEEISCTQQVLEVISPPERSGEIVLPLDFSITDLSLNGYSIWQDGISVTNDIQVRSDGLYILIGPGSSVLHVSRICSELDQPAK
jgi:alpha-L-rhamnosidase